MSDDKKPSHFPEDDEISFTCADCGELRNWEDVSMEKHPRDEQQKFPICNDKLCSIVNKQLPGKIKSSEFRVDDTLE